MFHAGSPVSTNVPLWWGMLDNGGLCTHRAAGICVNLLPGFALNVKVHLKINSIKK